MQDQCRGWCWSTGVSVAATGLEVAKSAQIKATNLNQNCYEQDDADDDRSDDDDDDDNDDDDDAGFPTGVSQSGVNFEIVEQDFCSGRCIEIIKNIFSV